MLKQVSYIPKIQLILLVSSNALYLFHLLVLWYTGIVYFI